MATDEIPLADSPALKLHASLVMRTVGTAVAGLRDITSLVPTLVQLAERHSDFRVLPEHFPVVGEALLWTLGNALEERYTLTPSPHPRCLPPSHPPTLTP